MDRAKRPAPRAAAALLAGSVPAAIALALEATVLPEQLSAVTVALVLGLVVGSTIGPDAATLSRAAKALITVAIVLVGLRIRLADVTEVGAPAVALASLAVVTGIAAALAVGRALGVERIVTALVAVGTAICGNTAILAVAPILRAKQSQITYALATITAFGTLAIVAFPLVGAAAGMSDRTFGLWAGTGVHDTSQVLATGFAYSDAAGETATIVKLVRNAFLGPVVLAVAVLAAGAARAGWRSLNLPWFVWAFAAAAVLASLGVVPDAAVSASTEVAHVLIVLGIGAIGAATDVRVVRALGARPFALGFLAMASVSTAVLAALYVIA